MWSRYPWLNSLVDYKNNRMLMNIFDLIDNVISSLNGNEIPINIGEITYDFGYLSLNDNEDDFNPDQTGPDSGEDGSDSGNGPDPGNGSDSGNGPDRDNKSSGKGKGKAKVTTPEEMKEWYTDLDEEREQDDIEKAKWNSLNEFKVGESSKQGESYKQGESSKQCESFEFLEYLKEQKKFEEYHESQKLRKEAMRAFNDIMHKINNDGGNVDQKEKEFLLNESIQIREAFDYYSDKAQNLKNELNIHSSEEECSEQNSDGESWSEYSSDEEFRPSKRPKK
uniref:cytochrome c oxidase subunit 2 n=1 Tax=Acrocalymma vagum TaxID=1589764 RepID=UPI002A832494|nr:cytochrome c oxidase subunit 2 [Acrocalymma vagum]WOH21445.1 cytochrome c oxidase subunit 2 [Acrocalymma vagum]